MNPLKILTEIDKRRPNVFLGSHTLTCSVLVRDEATVTTVRITCAWLGGGSSSFEHSYTHEQRDQYQPDRDAFDVIFYDVLAEMAPW